MKINNFLIGISIIVSTFMPIISISIYETKTGNYIGYYGSPFLVPICLGIFIISIAFTKKKESKDD